MKSVEVYTGRKDRDVKVWSKDIHICTIYFDEDLVSEFWRNLSDTRGYYILEGKLVDILSEKQNMHWGDRMHFPCIKYKVYRGTYIRTMMLPTRCTIILTDEAKDILAKQKRNPSDRLIIRNIVHYILRVMSVTKNKILYSSSYKQSFVFPKRAFKESYSALFLFQTIPGADITSTKSEYIVSMPMEEARKLSGYFLPFKPNGLNERNVLYGETFFNPKYIELKEN